MPPTPFFFSTAPKHRIGNRPFMAQILQNLAQYPKPNRSQSPSVPPHTFLAFQRASQGSWGEAWLAGNTQSARGMGPGGSPFNRYNATGGGLGWRILRETTENAAVVWRSSQIQPVEKPGKIDTQNPKGKPCFFLV